jgi:phosphatidylserine decarboxylase
VFTVIGANIHPVMFLVGMAGTLFTLYFFRDPERKIAATEGQILSPADGKVLSIDEVKEPDFIGGRCKRISIFLSVFDVHINRAPIGGTIETVRYNRGKFAIANTDKASADNESNLIGIDGGTARFAVKQIAGAVARRIICYCKPRESVRVGDRIGMIRFGSRTELYVPLECEILVSVGQKVKGGISLIGAYNGTIEEKP